MVRACVCRSGIVSDPNLVDESETKLCECLYVSEPRMADTRSSGTNNQLMNLAWFSATLRIPYLYRSDSGAYVAPVNRTMACDTRHETRVGSGYDACSQ